MLYFREVFNQSADDDSFQYFPNRNLSQKLTEMMLLELYNAIVHHE